MVSLASTMTSAKVEPASQQPPLEPAPPQGSGAGKLVARNVIFLVLSQFVTAPLSLLANAVMGRYLGPGDFGLLYLLGTTTGFVFLVVDWGQQTTLAGMTARAPERSGVLLGSALTLRLLLTAVAYGLSAASLLVLGYPAAIQWPYLLVFVSSGLTGPVGAIGAILRGHERMSLLVRINIATALLQAAIPVGVLLAGGRLTGLLWANIAVSGLCLALSIVSLRMVTSNKLRVDRQVINELTRTGTTFMIFGVVLVLQKYVDAVILARMAPAEVVGWYSAAAKLQGFIIFPSTTLAWALYPTLSRLYQDSERAAVELTSSALEAVAIFAVPASLGCLLFADVGISLFSQATFGPAAATLQMLSPFIFLVYFNIVLGTSLMAAGKQVHWTWAQSSCVLVSLVADPLLIPIFQRRYGNGGLGVGVAAIISEGLMAGAALLLAPRGILGGRLLRTMACTLLAGGAMTAAALATRWMPWPASMALALAAYAVILFAVGGVGPAQRQLLATVVVSKLRRKP